MTLSSSFAEKTELAIFDGDYQLYEWLRDVSVTPWY